MDKLKDTFKDLSITNDEVKKLSDAFKNEEFRKLFREYAEELQDPENRRKYEEELTAMENERGMDVEFINPMAGHVLKTIQNGEKKIFVNICTSDKVEPAKVVPCNKNGTKGSQWSIPHSFAPPREDIDKKKDDCLVYDVVFNPQTYKSSIGDTRFRQMLHDTALQGIENSFKVTLDKANFRVLKMKMKGCPTATVIRKKRCDYEEKQEVLKNQNDGPLKFPYPNEAKESPKINYDVNKQATEEENYNRPVYSIKYSDDFGVANYVVVTHSSRPKKMIIEIKLPLVHSANSVDLDTDRTGMTLSTDKPVKYKLDLKFSYPVLSEKGTAKFDKTTRVLKLELPIEQLPEEPVSRLSDVAVDVDEKDVPKNPLIDDSLPFIENTCDGINSDLEVSPDEISLHPLGEELQIHNTASPKEEKVERITPNLLLRHRTNETLAFILCDIKNVNDNDLIVMCPPSESLNHNIDITFSTCGQGGWKTYYSLPLVLILSGSEYFDAKMLKVKISKENVTIRLPLSVGLSRSISVSYQNQIISFDKKDEYCYWKSLVEVNGTMGNDDTVENSFNIAYGNVNNEVLKIVCAPLGEEIEIKRDIQENIASESVSTEDAGAEAAVILSPFADGNADKEEICADCVVTIEAERKEDSSCEGLEEEVPNENECQKVEDECGLPNVAKEVKEETRTCEEAAPRTHEVEGIIPSEYFEQRREAAHRTICAVALDERLLFDME